MADNNKIREGHEHTQNKGNNNMLMFKMFRGFMFLSFPDVFLLLTFYIAHIFINLFFFSLPLRHVDNNVYLQHTLSMTKNVRRCVFSGLLKFALLEKT